MRANFSSSCGNDDETGRVVTVWRRLSLALPRKYAQQEAKRTDTRSRAVVCGALRRPTHQVVRDDHPQAEEAEHESGADDHLLHLRLCMPAVEVAKDRIKTRLLVQVKRQGRVVTLSTMRTSRDSTTHPEVSAGGGALQAAARRHGRRDPLPRLALLSLELLGAAALALRLGDAVTRLAFVARAVQGAPVRRWRAHFGGLDVVWGAGDTGLPSRVLRPRGRANHKRRHDHRLPTHGEQGLNRLQIKGVRVRVWEASSEKTHPFVEDRGDGQAPPAPGDVRCAAARESERLIGSASHEFERAS